VERHRQTYYEALQAAVRRAQQIVELREQYRQAAAAIGTANALALVDLICENPVVTTKSIEGRLGVSRPTALRLLRRIGGAMRTERGQPKECVARGRARDDECDHGGDRRLTTTRRS
jgi:hypothetical protein